MEEHSIAYEMLKTIKLSLKIVSIIAIVELVVILVMAYFMYDAQFDYVEETTQQVEETTLDNSSIIQN